ncbi:MAG: RtcB family protein [Roseiflexaceae bacterium]
MKINELLQPWKGDKRYTAMSARAAALKKARASDEEITATIIAEFGEPPQIAELFEAPQPYTVIGEVGNGIEQAALDQLELALRIPVAINGALLPDAHPGYALPVGGVVALHNAVAPAMVGVDIACRMHLTIFAEAPDLLKRNRSALFADLQASTVFGVGASQARRTDHAVLSDPRWDAVGILRGMKQLAANQIGTSGGGNHFAEIVVGERMSDDADLPVQFLGLLTHSGSRGIGHRIAQHYMRVAAQETALHARVPRMYEWLDLDSEAGQEYWTAMHIAGDFAQANHEIIHAKFIRRSGLTPLHTIEHPHNFAWRDGDRIIHRKGATPAELGTLGIIPGSMASASYLVEGRGAATTLESASHGAGRIGSRTKAREQINLKEVQKYLAARDILVAGLNVEEAPQAYKDIEQVIQLQIAADLIRPLARMHPVAVIMSGDRGED